MMTKERLAEIEADALDGSTSHVRRAEMLELVAEVRRLGAGYEISPFTQPVQPPVDNDFVAPGGEQFSQEVVEHNKRTPKKKR